MDFTLYWFMFPIAICVATVAMLSGIGGTAIFMPIFLLLLPLLGPEYPLNDPVTAVAAALLTSTFGFTSGLIGYYRQKLIDLNISKLFLVISIPAALVGVLSAHWIPPWVLRLSYGILLLLLSVIMIRGFTFLFAPRNPVNRSYKTLVDKWGNQHKYQDYIPRIIPTILGGFITGMLSTGIGEIVMPQLIKEGKIPLPVAAASSVVVVMGTMLVAALAHTLTLIRTAGLDAVPWHLICYTIPGVIIGGQIGPFLQGRLPSKPLTKGFTWIFLILGICMIWTVFRNLLISS